MSHFFSSATPSVWRANNIFIGIFAPATNMNNENHLISINNLINNPIISNTQTIYTWL